ncbi:MAG TPA: alpha/beta hydrolase [Blastocatellia bacterium]|nr:alpha/beta hydrolase [Blastocatellia bacterium]
MAKRQWFTIVVGVMLVAPIMQSAKASLPPSHPIPAVRADQVFDSNGVKIHYVVKGAGEPVVLIHGLYSSAMINWGLPGTADLLAKHYRVIALDLPGHGQSDKPDDENAYGLQLVEDIARLMDHLGIKKAHIVGYSMGGMIAVKFMSLYQDRVLSCVIGGFGWLREGSPLQAFWSLTGKQRRGTERNGDTAPPPALTRSLGKLALTESELKAIHVPTEVIVGDRDPVKVLYVTSLQRVRPDWPVVEIDNAGHLDCIVKPQFKNKVAAWLDGHR